MDDFSHIADTRALARSLTAEDTALLPHLAYLLQDIEELGTPFSPIRRLAAMHIADMREARFLDLACGKGEIGVRIAAEFGPETVMVDALPGFIAAARAKAERFGVVDRCRFLVEDITATAARERGYDCVLYLAVGDILGRPAETLATLAGTIRAGGYILIDETFLADDAGSVRFEYDYPAFEEWEEAYRLNSLSVLGRFGDDAGEREAQNDFNNRAIARRAEELAARYPERAELFQRYVESQLDECGDLDDSLGSNLCLLQRG